MTDKNLIIKLCRTNLAIIQQKLDLIDRIEMKHGLQKLHDIIYKTPCPLVHASIGQHIRHSIDHIERAALVAAKVGSINDHGSGQSPAIHYDIRERGTEDEHDVKAARERMTTVRTGLKYIIDGKVNVSSEQRQSINTCFILSGDDKTETYLPTTIERELSFTAHHAIHHCAMIKVIVTNPNGLVQLRDSELPINFGLAPSTINFENSNSS